MSRYAAFLRGMNVGGHRLTNDELRSRFAELGFKDVGCFRASGNVIFAGEEQPPATVMARIEQGLADALGYAVPTFVRTAEEVRAIAAGQPFARELVEASTGKLHVALLSVPLSARASDEVLSMQTDADRLAFGERELFWLPSGRMIDSGLDLKAVEALLGMITLRTKNTIELIAGKYFDG
jgi:uncharacterized protein (DUF1697 family)